MDRQIYLRLVDGEQVCINSSDVQTVKEINGTSEAKCIVKTSCEWLFVLDSFEQIKIKRGHATNQKFEMVPPIK